MTDRLQGLTVAFEQDIRDDDAEQIIQAIRQLRGVAAVTGLVVNGTDFIARTRAMQEMMKALWKAVENYA